MHMNTLNWQKRSCDEILGSFINVLRFLKIGHIFLGRPNVVLPWLSHKF